MQATAQLNADKKHNSINGKKNNNHTKKIITEYYKIHGYLRLYNNLKFYLLNYNILETF